jgi:hypothetical protein
VIFTGITCEGRRGAAEDEGRREDNLRVGKHRRVSRDLLLTPAGVRAYLVGVNAGGKSA